MNEVKNYSSTNLKYLRLTTNTPTDKVGKVIGKSANAIYNYETGIRTLSVDDSMKLADLFNVSYGDFITKDLRIEENVELDNEHKVDKIIMDNLKTLTEEDKQKIVSIIEIIKGSDSNL